MNIICISVNLGEGILESEAAFKQQHPHFSWSASSNRRYQVKLTELIEQLTRKKVIITKLIQILSTSTHLH